jgi:hypothetical protein
VFEAARVVACRCLSLPVVACHCVLMLDCVSASLRRCVSWWMSRRPASPSMWWWWWCVNGSLDVDVSMRCSCAYV